MTKAGVVPEFKGDYAFLSNFYAANFTWRNVEYGSAETAFQSAKYLCLKSYGVDTLVERQVLAQERPAEAKRRGGWIPIDIDDWDNRKVAYMREIVFAKFNQVPGLAGKLINTGAAMLVEGNDWNDQFWGRCNGKGLNCLGVILMEVRGRFLYGAVDSPPPF